MAMLPTLLATGTRVTLADGERKTLNLRGIRK
jgi:hypothetical protein